jgi:hypothetical protein
MVGPVWRCAKCDTILGDEQSAARFNDLSTQLTAALKRAEDAERERDTLHAAGEKREPNPEWEAKADAYHAAALAEAGVDPQATLAMLERWKADAEPANEMGQVSFSRAMLDSATDALRLTLADLAAANATIAKLKEENERRHERHLKWKQLGGGWERLATFVSGGSYHGGRADDDIEAIMDRCDSLEAALFDAHATIAKLREDIGPCGCVGGCEQAPQSGPIFYGRLCAAYDTARPLSAPPSELTT